MADADVINIMIVDDVADTCDQLEKLLFFEKDIHVVAKVHNGREAVEMAKKNQTRCHSHGYQYARDGWHHGD